LSSSISTRTCRTWRHSPGMTERILRRERREYSADPVILGLQFAGGTAPSRGLGVGHRRRLPVQAPPGDWRSRGRRAPRVQQRGRRQWIGLVVTAAGLLVAGLTSGVHHSAPQ
jgi:hypothetical protein